MCGGLSVALGLRPENVLLNDINPHSINFYLWLQRGLTIPFQMRNDRSRYERCRDRFNALIANGGERSAEAAGLFYYLNRTCYNGLCRFNNSGEFNVPFGRYAKINYRRDFLAYAPVMDGWKFTVGDFATIDLKRGDFVYADPPYDVEFTKYSKEDFGWEDQVRLAEWLAGHRGVVVLSNQATPRIVSLYRKLKFRLKFLDAPRRISRTGDRTPAREVVAVKNG
jgi:DNA adenine methylase